MKNFNLINWFRFEKCLSSAIIPLKFVYTMEFNADKFGDGDFADYGTLTIPDTVNFACNFENINVVDYGKQLR